MLFIAHGDIGRADEVLAGFLAFILLIVVIGIGMRDSWKNRKRYNPPVDEQTDNTKGVD